MTKKKTPAPTRGRPRLFGKRIIWNVLLDPTTAQAADKRRATTGLSQSQLVEELLRKWLGGR